MIPTNTNLCYDCENIRTINGIGHCTFHDKDLEYLGYYRTDGKPLWVGYEGVEKKPLYYKTSGCPHLMDSLPPVTYSKYTVLVSIPDGDYCKNCAFVHDNSDDDNSDMVCSITGNDLQSIKTERIIIITKNISDKIERYEYVKDSKCPNTHVASLQPRCIMDV